LLIALEQFARAVRRTAQGCAHLHGSLAPARSSWTGGAPSRKARGRAPKMGSSSRCATAAPLIASRPCPPNT
jgi:hypothetical protein